MWPMNNNSRIEVELNERDDVPGKTIFETGVCPPRSFVTEAVWLARPREQHA